MQQRNAELVAKHRPEVTIGAAAQLQDLRLWIDNQMKEEKMDRLDGFNSESQRDHSGTRDTSQVNLTMKNAAAASEKSKAKLPKPKLPGNNHLAEEEESKLGARENRYGAFQPK